MPLPISHPISLDLPSAPKGHILIVDDDSVNTIVVTGLLESHGYQVSQAGSGEEALLRIANEKPDLVLLDVTLPGIDGFKTSTEIKRTLGDEAPPVIFVTSRDSTDDIVAGFANSGVDYLTKPVSESEALARIHTHISNRNLIKQLAVANQRKNQVLGMAAHDIRNPLGSICGLTELMSDGAFGPVGSELLDCIKLINSESSNLLELVNQLLDVSSIEAGVLKINFAPGDLNALIVRSVYTARINASRKKTQILHQPKSGSTTLRIDEGKIRQVVDNLISNAVKYSPQGSTVKVTHTIAGGTHIISVEDEGPGIPESERHKLFKEFGTLSAKATGGEKSTGLGLAISRRIIEAHHGSITAENLSPRGSKFSFTLPAT
ncbi:hypothetical protein CMV30_13885 [Nibricoccus aquaticus]|uniref:histidine kinase n=1 Tax=Nibricoccus aquaticus TaxID=2576891 RepID=A0A290QI08_9BACT|nr:hybrid sensor histidine kinase/response regulator [Nibricoccus aquaticus]ATC64968.1 hypothetical protein CMV30_13885 [Nibricoccus aquaticus]